MKNGIEQRERKEKKGEMQIGQREEKKGMRRKKGGRTERKEEIKCKEIYEIRKGK